MQLTAVITKFFLWLAVAAFLASCQATGMNAVLKPLVGNYNLFHDPADGVSDLLDQGHVLKASEIYNENGAYFAANRSTEEVQTLETRLSALLWKEIGETVSRDVSTLRGCNWPAPQAEWARIKECLAIASQALEKIRSHTVLKVPALKPAEFVELEEVYAAREQAVLTSTVDEFRKFRMFAGSNFFSTYPIPPEIGTFYREHSDLVRSKLVQADLPSLASFATSNEAIPDDLQEYVADLHFDRSLQALDYPKAGFRAVVEALRERDRLKLANAADAPKKGRIAVITLAGPSDVQHFPIELEQSSLPFTHLSKPVSAAFDSKTIADFDFVVFVHPTSTIADRKITASQTVESQYQATTKTVPNSAYLAAQARIREKELHYQSAIANDTTMRLTAGPCYGAGCIGQALGGIASAIGKSKAQDALAYAIAELQSLSPTIEEPIYAPYEFVRSNVKTTKRADIQYWIFDKLQNSAISGRTAVSEDTDFVVNFGIRETDSDYSKQMDGAETEKSLDDSLSKPMQVDTDALLNKILSQNLRPTPHLTVTAIWSRIQDQVRAARPPRDKPKKTAYAARQPALFASVVKVLASNSLGSGFYVTPHMIVTNAHVVGEIKFADIVQHDGTETFGKVVAKDLRRDLALIRANREGKVVSFFNGAIPIGNEVTAIGHPKGLSFTITRGIVSAVRELPSMRLPSEPLVLFVQTDAAINQGNSGGPLFLATKLIGVNTQIVRKDISEGLSFAVHVNELLAFLKENGVTTAER